jgi:hypothetical protein
MLTIRGGEQRMPIPRARRKTLSAKPIFVPPVFISEKVSSAVSKVTDIFEVSYDELFSRKRDAHIINARRCLMKIMYHDFNWSAQRIANYLKMDISTIQYHLGLRSRSKVKRGPFKAL